MQELYQIIKQRFDKLALMADASKPTIKEYREEEKVRCEKQAMILSKLRSTKKSLNANIRSNYFLCSYKIMRVIDPNFHHEGMQKFSDDNFLNNFVELYESFFSSFQHKFEFKVKLKNIVRPTNQNIFNDMVKYLADFSRDYTQHMYVWKMKQSQRVAQSNETESLKKVLTSHHSNRAVLQSSTLNQIYKQKSVQKCRNTSRTGIMDVPIKKTSYQFDLDAGACKTEYNRIYGVLEVQSFSTIIALERAKVNIDTLRMRMNQMYKGSQLRNYLVKTSISQYFNSFNSKFNPTAIESSSQHNLLKDSVPLICHPFTISISILKNGFSCLKISQEEITRIVPNREKMRLTCLSNRDSVILQQSKPRGNRRQYVLNSLKVLRASQNFLPPLIEKMEISRPNSEQKQQKQQTKPSAHPKQVSTSNSDNILSLDITSTKQAGRLSYNNIINYNQQLMKQAQRRQKIQKKRLFAFKKHCREEMGQSGSQMNIDDDQIDQWLLKICVMKKMDRRKLLGLSLVQ